VSGRQVDAGLPQRRHGLGSGEVDNDHGDVDASFPAALGGLFERRHIPAEQHDIVLGSGEPDRDGPPDVAGGSDHPGSLPAAVATHDDRA
jgi:hypothetical protein